MDRCAECGFDHGHLDRSELGDALRDGTSAFGVLLRRSPADLTRRPEPGVWSPLEYACHVRDVLEVQHSRSQQALTTQLPVYESMRREELVTERAYNESVPADVARELHVRSAALAELWSGLSADGWAAEGVYNFPTTRARSVEWIARHTVHEVVHHLWDCAR